MNTVFFQYSVNNAANTGFGTFHVVLVVQWLTHENFPPCVSGSVPARCSYQIKILHGPHVGTVFSV